MMARFPPPPHACKQAVGIVLLAGISVLLLVGPGELRMDAKMDTQTGPITVSEVPPTYSQDTFTGAPAEPEMTGSGVCDLLKKVQCERFLGEKQNSSINWERVIKACRDSGYEPFFQESLRSITYRCTKKKQPDGM